MLPGVSAFALAAARLAWPLDGVGDDQPARAARWSSSRCMSRPAPGCSSSAHDRGHAAAVAAWLAAHGFGESRMIALAHMGGPKRGSRSRRRPRRWSARGARFSYARGRMRRRARSALAPRTAGLPDDAFEHDGKLTKREFRALALAKLMPHPGALLWDIGAGCGSVGIEWMRAADHAHAIALEPSAERRAMAARNAVALGVPASTSAMRGRPKGLAALPDAGRDLHRRRPFGARTMRIARRSAEARRPARRPCRDAGERGAPACRVCRASAASWCASRRARRSRSAISAAGGR